MLDFIRVAPENHRIKAAVLDKLSSFIDSGDYIQGQAVRDFEAQFAKAAGVKYAIGVNSGTDALFLSLKALEIGPGDEVITVALTFPATVMAILNCGAIPVLVDIDDTLNIDPDAIKAHITPRTRAIMPVHWTGKMADMKRIMAIAERHQLAVIEDAAQAFGAFRDHRAAGSWGQLGCFSFFPTKNLSTMGDGGMITTNDAALNAKIRLLQDFGRVDREHFGICGYNSRLDTLHALILLEKMNYIDEWNQKRIQLAERYTQSLSERYGTPQTEADEQQVYHLYICKNHIHQNIELVALAREAGIDFRIHYREPIHLQDFIKDQPVRVTPLPKTDALTRHILTLPCFPDLRPEEQEKIIDFLMKH